jgi:hypothetical protein
MKTSVQTLALFGLLLLTGCAMTPPDYGYTRPFKFGPRKAVVKTYDTGHFRTNYDALVAGGETDKAKAERDRIVFELLYFIDSSHGQFERDTTASKVWVDVGSDFAILGLSGAGTVAGGEATKAILAAIVGGIQGAQLTVNKRVFRDHAIEALQAQMNAAMMKRKAEIITRMKKGVEDYPLDLALSDVVEYYYDGTFTRAFQNLVTESKKQEEVASGEVSKAIKAATEGQIDDLSFITAQIKAIRTAADEQKALERTMRILAAAGNILTVPGIDVSTITTRDQAMEKLGDLQDELWKPENRAKLPQIRKLFETDQ